MNNTIYILSLEPIDTRYTSQWYHSLPNLIADAVTANKKDYKVENVPGNIISGNTTDGAFLNFAETNLWKNTQINRIVTKFCNGEIKEGDIFVFPDAWHTGIIQLKYMSDLLGIPIKIHSIWHAGSYDPWDFLGQKVKNKLWSSNVERAFFYASDCNYFATVYHSRLFRDNLHINAMEHYDMVQEGKVVVTGLPFDYLKDLIVKPDSVKKENLILFPHRIATEKQVEVFKELEKALPEFKFIVCQESKLSKEEYHNLLYRAKIVFSANLQETLGIGQYEGALAGAFPLVPDRLSYTEMYPDMFKYLDDYTNVGLSYEGKKYLVNRIKDIIFNYEMYVPEIKDLVKSLNPYFSGVNLANKIVTA